MPVRRHVTEITARAFFRSKLSQDDYRWVVRHLLGRCERCSALMRRVAIAEGFFRETRPEGREYSFEDVVFYPAAESKSLALGKLAGLAQVAFLERVPPESRMEVVRQYKDFQHLGLYDRLIEQAIEKSGHFHNLRDGLDRAMEYTALALTVAAEMKTTPTLRNDLMAEGYATLGKIRRIARDFTGARDACTKAWAYREEGTSDPLVDARIMQEEAAWFVDLGEYLAAEGLLGNALKEYRRVKDTHREGRTLLQIGITRSYHDPQAAMALFAQAEGKIDLRQEPALAWTLRHHALFTMNDLGQAEEALALLERSRGLYAKLAGRDRWVILRLHWLEGRIALNLGRVEVAEEILCQLFTVLHVEARHPMEGAQVAVDALRAIAVQEGRARDAVRYVEMAAPTLRSFQLHREGLQLWHSLGEVIAAGLAHEIRWTAIQDYFRRTWHKPAPFPERPSAA